VNEVKRRLEDSDSMFDLPVFLDFSNISTPKKRKFDRKISVDSSVAYAAYVSPENLKSKKIKIEAEDFKVEKLKFSQRFSKIKNVKEGSRAFVLNCKLPQRDEVMPVYQLHFCFFKLKRCVFFTNKSPKSHVQTASFDDYGS
jgi:hypothetical protein